MKSQEIILIAVAETSVIVRSGLVAVLKRLPDMNIQTIEVTSKEGLQHCMEAHTPNILIVNPQFEGWFDWWMLSKNIILIWKQRLYH